MWTTVKAGSALKDMDDESESDEGADEEDTEEFLGDAMDESPRRFVSQLRNHVGWRKICASSQSSSRRRVVIERD
jgi:hypothetical protein